MLGFCILPTRGGDSPSRSRINAIDKHCICRWKAVSLLKQAAASTERVGPALEKGHRSTVWKLVQSYESEKL